MLILAGQKMVEICDYKPVVQLHINTYHNTPQTNTHMAHNIFHTFNII